MTPATLSMTGVDVMPISGTTCEHPRPSLGDSPEPSSDRLHSVAPVTASSRVHRVVFGGDKQHVVDALSRNGQAGQEQRLGIDLAVDGEEPDFPERRDGDRRRRQRGLVEILAGSCVVGVVGDNIAGRRVETVRRQ